MHPVIEPPPPILNTERLALGDWTEADVAALAVLSADPGTMRYFPALPSRQQIEEMVARQRAALAAGRPGLFAVRTSAEGRFLGFVGLAETRFDAFFTPCVEIGWRLARDAWGHGYATEAARAVLEHGFVTLGLPEIVSFTAVLNQPSQAVMRRLGMHSDPEEDFDHPRVESGHPLQRHVLYRLRAEEWRDARSRLTS